MKKKTNTIAIPGPEQKVMMWSRISSGNHSLHLKHPCTFVALCCCVCSTSQSAFAWQDGFFYLFVPLSGVLLTIFLCLGFGFFFALHPLWRSDKEFIKSKRCEVSGTQLSSDEKRRRGGTAKFTELKWKV